MEIKTKYNIGDVLFYMKDNSICSDPVGEIDIKVYSSGGSSVYYSLGTNSYSCPRRSEKEIFKTRKALITYLSRSFD